jgi:hypothetical protein
MSTTMRTSGLHIHESTGTARLATNVQEHRPAWFVEGTIEVISLLKHPVIVWDVAIRVREVVNLYIISRSS